MLDTQKRNKPKYKIIESDLLTMIRQGRIEVGQQVPTEYSISRQYEVSRLTARKALEGLEIKGFLERTPGKGSFVTDWQNGENKVKIKSPSSKTSDSIAMLTIDDDVTKGNPENWDMRLLRAMTYEAEKYNYNITVCGVSGMQIANNDLPVALREKKVCGAIVDGRVTEIAIRRLIDSELSFIITGSHQNRLNVPEITHDLEDATYKLTTALLELDHGPVWMTGKTWHEYYAGELILKGYQRAILDYHDPARFIHLVLCQSDQCKKIVEQMARSDHKKHCVIVLNMDHLHEILKSIDELGLDRNDFLFASIGRYHSDLLQENQVMLCEIEPPLIAAEAVGQLVRLAEHGEPLTTRKLKLSIKKINNNRRPFELSWH